MSNIVSKIVVAGIFSISLSGALAAQDYKLITSKAEFVRLVIHGAGARLSEGTQPTIIFRPKQFFPQSPVPSQAHGSPLRILHQGQSPTEHPLHIPVENRNHLAKGHAGNCC